MATLTLRCDKALVICRNERLELIRKSSHSACRANEATMQKKNIARLSEAAHRSAKEGSKCLKKRRGSPIDCDQPTNSQ